MEKLIKAKTQKNYLATSEAIGTFMTAIKEVQRQINREKRSYIQKKLSKKKHG